MNGKLSEKALLVHLRVSMWSGTKKDQEVTGETCDRYGAEDDAGGWWTNFLPPKEIKRLRAESARLRDEAKKNTLPWFDRGLRIIKSTEFMEYSARVRKAIAQYETEIEDFVTKRYPEILAHMPDRLKGLLRGRSMPSAKEIRYKYGAKMFVVPVPDVADFRADLAADEVADIRKQAEESYNEMVKTAMMSVWKQFIAVVTKIETRLSDPDYKIHDSLIGNLIDFCYELPKLNLMEDKDLDKMRDEAVKKLCKMPDELRKDKDARKKVAKEAKDLIAKMKDFMGEQ